MNKHPRESADTIRKFAKHYRHADVDFDRSGAEWLDSFIDWLRENEAEFVTSRGFSLSGRSSALVSLKPLAGNGRFTTALGDFFRLRNAISPPS